MEEWFGSVKVINNGDYRDDEIRHYLEMARAHAGVDLMEVTLKPLPGNKVEIKYVTITRHFERIRRITGEPRRIARQVA